MSGPKGSDPQKLRRLMQYSGMGIQMVVTILLFMWLGTWLDGDAEGAALWTLVCTLVGVFVALYLLIKGIMKL